VGRGSLEVSTLENLGRCPRCNKFMVQEEWNSHQCDFHNLDLTSATELVMDTITDLRVNRNGDHVYVAWGLDRVFYRLVECKHNPPHMTKPKLTDDTARRPPPDKLPV
jgi:hypothetical protein